MTAASTSFWCPWPPAARKRYWRMAAFRHVPTLHLSPRAEGRSSPVAGRPQNPWPQSRSACEAAVKRASASSRSMKCSGACAATNSGSAGERQRSGSGPRYSISSIAAGVRMNAGTSAEQRRSGQLVDHGMAFVLPCVSGRSCNHQTKHSGNYGSSETEQAWERRGRGATCRASISAPATRRMQVSAAEPDALPDQGR